MEERGKQGELEVVHSPVYRLLVSFARLGVTKECPFPFHVPLGL